MRSAPPIAFSPITALSINSQFLIVPLSPSQYTAPPHKNVPPINFMLLNTTFGASSLTLKNGEL